MTRENKLALIIGFGLVLVVGILVSDHFSPASTDDAANLVASETRTVTDDRDRESLLVARPVDRAATADPIVGPAAVEHEIERSTPPPPDLGVDTASTIASTSTSTSGPDVIRLPGQADLLAQDRDAIERVRPVDRGVPFEWRTIKKGESLASICRDAYGDPKLWHRLAEFNEDRIDDPNRVRAGVTIRLPERLGGSTMTASAAGGSSDRGTGAASRGVEYREHTLKPGETLSEVAQRLLGTATAWRDIYELNKSTIKDPDRVPAGTVLRLPPRG